ncbi:MAG: metallophosphoesterase [Labilithrix sp.]|nr:metallophosphoesterase [Labilithrix sp.]
MARLPVKGLRLFALASVAILAVACGSEDGAAGGPPSSTPSPPGETTDPPTSDDPDVAAKLVEKPWEVISNKGETYLPNVFYADASENEQIMPYALDGHVMIDRLVYPTLGNPNLFTKTDPTEQLVTVLRIEDEAYAHLGAKIEPVAGSSLSKLNVTTNDPATGFAFFLVPRAARETATDATAAISSGNGTGVFRIYPNEVLVNPIPADMPEVLKRRKTLRFVFRQAALQRIPPGLYDLRFEVRKENALYKPTGNATGIYEYQYNAVRVFDAEPDEYAVLNVTDTQVSVGSMYDAKTKDKLSELVQFLNTTSDPNVTKAQFITFNGDLHNGGSPASLRQRTVAWTYNEEAKAIVDALKHLPVPIFLTAGNHDGYVATGHVPSAVKAVDTGLFDSLESVVNSATPKAWPDFGWTQYQAYLAATEAADALGGRHRDIFTGGFTRKPLATGFDGWKELPRQDRNYVLYDGFHQWQKTYGPLHMSWKFGKSFYVSLNSYELRQHRRSGWGMYTVNYGGGMSDTQMAWLDRELLRAKVTGDEVVLLAHHDPRGGHKNQDLGYYFEQLEYRSVYQSAINYLVGKVWNPAVCKLPDWALSRNQGESCVHDGLQEWMRPDEEFDCAPDQKKGDGTCVKGLPEYYMSGIELMKRLTTNTHVRTFLLGHTHYNQLEVLQAGDELLPGKLAIGGGGGATMAATETETRFATLEIENPIRAFSFQEIGARHADYDHHALPMAPVVEQNRHFAELMDRVLPGLHRTLDAPAPGKARELMLLRLVSNADLTSQTYGSGKSALGFTVLHVNKTSDVRAHPLAQINKATFFVNTGSNVFTNLRTVNLDRTSTLKAHDAANPMEQVFDW